ncbi:hypothetical protein CMV_022763 [Castanea mollissima]|uniref:Uncharacterized protein n=1 Tax=Castanea mollissima TaxID=60419 RepID=A0A8J4QQP9_9ROSI|nr:hypothetical protein CMV_022763 [Castanea mollissima]
MPVFKVKIVRNASLVSFSFTVYMISYALRALDLVVCTSSFGLAVKIGCLPALIGVIVTICQRLPRCNQQILNGKFP